MKLNLVMNLMPQMFYVKYKDVITDETVLICHHYAQALGHQFASSVIVFPVTSLGLTIL